MFFIEPALLKDTLLSTTVSVLVVVYCGYLLTLAGYWCYEYICDIPRRNVGYYVSWVFAGLLFGVACGVCWAVLATIIAYTQGWLVLAVGSSLSFYLLLRTARGVVRLKKQLNKHVSDPKAHKE